MPRQYRLIAVSVYAAAPVVAVRSVSAQQPALLAMDSALWAASLRGLPIGMQSCRRLWSPHPVSLLEGLTPKNIAGSCLDRALRVGGEAEARLWSTLLPTCRVASRLPSPSIPVILDWWWRGAAVEPPLVRSLCNSLRPCSGGAEWGYLWGATNQALGSEKSQSSDVELSSSPSFAL